MHETNSYNHFIYHSNLVHKQKERNTPSGHLDDLAINLTKIYIQDHWFKKLYIGIKLVGSLFGIITNFTWDQYFYMRSQKFTLGSQYPMIPVGITPPPRSQCKIAILLVEKKRCFTSFFKNLSEMFWQNYSWIVSVRDSRILQGFFLGI